MINKVGILAYGSLIDDPGPEIKGEIDDVLKDGVLTPFCVEFARKSRTRKCAPTLIPVDDCGARVPAQILILKEEISEREAKNRLWRRETGNVGKTNLSYNPPADPKPNDVIVRRIENFNGIGVVIYTKIGRNIETLTAQELARLALKSARELADGRDGISYLIAAKRNGIKTPLSEPYENEIKRQMGVANLKDALKKIHAERHS